ncbi:hypothetical protein GGF46_004798 [Coemansia sp. RSA 552]|nr:hypothetical protein GGF46_004798 [Coemansia sp. RSA 552]
MDAKGNAFCIFDHGQGEAGDTISIPPFSEFKDTITTLPCNGYEAIKDFPAIGEAMAIYIVLNPELATFFGRDYVNHIGASINNPNSDLRQFQ